MAQIMMRDAPLAMWPIRNESAETNRKIDLQHLDEILKAKNRMEKLVDYTHTLTPS
jgi:hypothetical protein